MHTNSTSVREKPREKLRRLFLLMIDGLQAIKFQFKLVFEDPHKQNFPVAMNNLFFNQSTVLDFLILNKNKKKQIIEMIEPMFPMPVLFGVSQRFFCLFFINIVLDFSLQKIMNKETKKTIPYRYN